MTKTVFVVDDDPDIVDALHFLLETVGYRVMVDSGRNAREKIRLSKPDIIVLDILLSGLDGRDIARELKASAVTRHIPIIMISAHPDAQDTAYSTGVEAFLAKPFEMDELLAVVSQYVKS